MCALNAKVGNLQIKQYYQRKVAEGKNPMSVMNAVTAAKNICNQPFKGVLLM